MNATEKPMALSWAVVEPVAFADTDALCVAVSVSAPLVVRGVPRPMVAFVSTIEMATAMTGVIASPPESVAFAPFAASMIEACPPPAVIARSCAPVRMTPSPIAAVVVSLTIETAIERPRPNVVPAVSPASAFVVEVESGSAEIVTSPVPPVSVTTDALPSLAVLDTSTRLNAREPATEFLPPPAPLVASAP